MPSAGILPPDTMAVAEVPKARRRQGQENADFGPRLPGRAEAGRRDHRRPGRRPKEPTPVATPEEFEHAVGDCAGKPVRVFYRRGAESAEQSVTVDAGARRRAALAGHRLLLEPRLRRPAGILGGEGRVRPATSSSRSPAGRRARASEVTASLETADKPVPVVVRRGNADVHLQLPPLTKDGSKRPSPSSPEMVVDRTEPGYPAERLELRPGDEVVSANGVEVKDARELGEDAARRQRAARHPRLAPGRKGDEGLRHAAAALGHRPAARTASGHRPARPWRSRSSSARARRSNGRSAPTPRCAA